ncbi:hypothetical protein L7F22_029345 [Adiantum nelumboides]|nr:hypothetical protein [Adiantum nelumboides]
MANAITLAVRDHLVYHYGSLRSANDSSLKSNRLCSWNAVISRYAKSSQGKRALEVYHEIRQRGFDPNVVTYLGALKGCASIKDPNPGIVIHSHIVKSGLETDILMGSTLVDMYVKCGKMGMARSVFDKLENRNVVSWGAMIAGYAQCGQGLTALWMFYQMSEQGINPDRVMFLCILKACCSLEVLGQGLVIHNQIVEQELELDITIGSSLIDFYTKFGSFEEAENVFRRLSKPNIVAWSALINGYALHDRENLAFEHFEKMQQAGIEAGRVAFLSILKASVNIGAIAEGRLIHDRVIKANLEMDLTIGNMLVDMYSKCGSLPEAKSLFDSLSHRDVVTYGALIAGYALNGRGQVALELFKRMRKEGIKPDRVALLAAVKACTAACALDVGKVIHYELIGSKFDLEVTLVTALVEMYIKCGCVGEAWELFKQLPNRDKVLWSTMLSGFVEHKQSHLVFQYLKDLREDGIQLDAVLSVCIIKACTNMRALAAGRLLHKQIVSVGLHSDVVVSSSLIDMYARCGSLEDAQNVFDELSNRNVVTWGTMIAGNVQHGQGFMALDLYNKMQQEGLKPEHPTFVCALKACCCVGALDQGRLLHMQIVESESESDLIIGNTLIDLYAKGNRPLEAQNIFNSMRHRDVVSWSALAAGYAMVGDYSSAKHCLDMMYQEGLRPDGVFFTSIISAFSHAGLVEEGHLCLEELAKGFGFRPCLEHYNCIIDLLGRSGSLKDGMVFLQAMPISPNAISWMSLLTGCRTHGHTQLARDCFEEGVCLKPESASSYVILSDLYAEAEKWDDALTVEEMKQCAAARKEPGRAWIEIHCKSFEFLVGDKHHPSSLEVGRKLIRLERVAIWEGFVPQVSTTQTHGMISYS